MPKRVLDRKDNLSRKQTRADLGPLRDNLIKLGTLKRYIHAQVQFQLFICANMWPFALSMEELDMQLRAFVEQAWEEGEQKALAGDAISGAQHFLLTRRQFPGAWKLLGVWGKLELPSRAPPMSWEIALALAGYAVSTGRLDWAALVLAGHHCCLRTMEMLELSVECVALNQQYLGTLTLMNTKIGQRRGQKEFVTVDSPFVGYWTSSKWQNPTNLFGELQKLLSPGLAGPRCSLSQLQTLLSEKRRGHSRLCGLQRPWQNHAEG